MKQETSEEQAGGRRWGVSWLARRLFDIPDRDTSFAKRGFHGGDPAVRTRLEESGTAFVQGYRLALNDARGHVLAPRLDATPAERRGFAYEGAAMGLALLDYFTPWRRRRVEDFLHGPGDPHAYMVHVGAGWALARLPGRVERFLERYDPLLRWLLVDGYGFHQGFFHGARDLPNRAKPRRLNGYACRVFDQGLGRSLWFVEGGDVARLPQTIARFLPERQSDLWSGLGLACVYAGQVDDAALRALRAAAGEFRPHLAQGACFAAKARARAGNVLPYTEMACRALSGWSVSQAARISDGALENLPLSRPEPSYEIWRQRIQQAFTHSISIIT